MPSDQLKPALRHPGLPGVRKPPERVYGNPGTGVRNQSERVYGNDRDRQQTAESRPCTLHPTSPTPPQRPYCPRGDQRFTASAGDAGNTQPGVDDPLDQVGLDFLIGVGNGIAEAALGSCGKVDLTLSAKKRPKHRHSPRGSGLLVGRVVASLFPMAHNCPPSELTTWENKYGRQEPPSMGDRGSRSRSCGCRLPTWCSLQEGDSAIGRRHRWGGLPLSQPRVSGQS